MRQRESKEEKERKLKLAQQNLAETPPEKGDTLAMILAMMITVLPVVLLIVGVIAGILFLLFS